MCRAGLYRCNCPDLRMQVEAWLSLSPSTERCHPLTRFAGLHVAAISSRSQEKANKLCKEHGIDQGFTDVPSLAAAGAQLNVAEHGSQRPLC